MASIIGPLVRAAIAMTVVPTTTAACGAAPDPSPSPAAAARPSPSRGGDPIPAPVAAEPGWTGRYRYTFSDGANAAGTAVTVQYTLDLAPSSCRFAAEGYQTDEVILCTARSGRDDVTIGFKSYSDGSTTDKYGNAVYGVGDPLFSLERAGGRLLTRWMGYPLPDDKPHPKGVYFTR